MKIMIMINHPTGGVLATVAKLHCRCIKQLPGVQKYIPSSLYLSCHHFYLLESSGVGYLVCILLQKAAENCRIGRRH